MAICKVEYDSVQLETRNRVYSSSKLPVSLSRTLEIYIKQ